MSKKVIIIGSGFAGLSAACFMAKEGWEVTVLEKHAIPGGRARQMKADGFTFDMGPSWYWMPDVFERFFNQFGKSVSEYYSLERLDPSYRIYFKDGPIDIPANYDALKAVFEKLEPGSGNMLDKFMQEAAYKYNVGMHKLVYKPGLSVKEFWDADLIKGIFKLDVFNSLKSHVAKHFSNSKLRELMEFPVLFLGALPQHIPALYSLMNYADIKGGTWYPEGGIYSVVEAMQQLAAELGVQFNFGEEVEEIVVDGGRATGVVTDKGIYTTDAIISGADYHFTETHLLAPSYRTYTEKYWDSRVLAPSCLLYYIGLNKQLDNVLHHSLFFDVPFDAHADEIYKAPQWPENPLFYVSVASKTDSNVAPSNGENIVILIPVASGLQGDTAELRERYFDKVIKRLEERTGQSIREAIVYKKTFSVSDFIRDYHSYKGNAYGLANILKQTAILRPSCRSKKVVNLFYTGQLTVPGPGVPPSLISGEVVAREVIKSFNR